MLPLHSLVLLTALAQAPADCDLNGIDDALELAPSLELSAPLHHAVGELPHILIAADLDGDLDLDLVSSDRAADTLSVLTNDGRSGFAPAVALDVADEPRGIDAGDIDLDGDLDLVSGNGQEDDTGDVPTVSVLVNHGGSFAPRVDFVANPARAGAMRSTHLADMDGDGRLDVINGFSNADTGGVISILPGTDGARFGAPRVTTASDRGFAAFLWAQYVAVGPVDTDAFPDVVTFSGQHLRNDGGGRLLPPSDLAPWSAPRGVALADLDMDVDLDLILTRTESVPAILGEVLAFTNDGEELRPAGASLDLGLLLQTGLGVGDLDGDALGDLALATTDGEVVLALGDGRGGFRPTAPRSGLGSSFPRWIIAADLNGDARPDVACPKQDSTVAVLLNLLGRDADRSGVLDVCERRFLRGDFDASGGLDIADAVRGLSHLFQGGAPSSCLESADTNDDGREDLADPVGLLRHLFQGGEPPPPPGPPQAVGESCSAERGREPFLGCVQYGACR